MAIHLITNFKIYEILLSLLIGNENIRGDDIIFGRQFWKLDLMVKIEPRMARFATALCYNTRHQE